MKKGGKSAEYEVLVCIVEDYRSGTEWVRFLNELICDFDDILNHPKYSCVEKIKTISSTYMAASNLNPHYKQGKYDKQSYTRKE